MHDNELPEPKGPPRVLRPSSPAASTRNRRPSSWRDAASWARRGHSADSTAGNSDERTDAQRASWGRAWWSRLWPFGGSARSLGMKVAIVAAMALALPLVLQLPAWLSRDPTAEEGADLELED